MNNDVKNGFDLDKVATDFLLKEWLKDFRPIKDEYRQKHIGDALCANGIAVDFKFDCYDNSNVVIEERQKSGSSWLWELDGHTLVMWVKCANGLVGCCGVSDLRDFTKTSLYKNRVSLGTKFTGSRFKNFTMNECKENIRDFHICNLSDKIWWSKRPEIMRQVKSNKLNIYKDKFVFVRKYQ